MRVNDDTPNDRLTLRFLAAPTDVTVAGTAVPAGRVLEWIDKAGYGCAVGWAGGNAVTAYVGDVNFRHPIRPGDLVEVHARILLTGRSSMHILVTVEASDVRRRSFTPAMHCIIIFVAVDENGRPRPVPEWKPWTTGDSTLQDRVRARIEPRRLIHEEMRAQSYTDASSTPRTVFRFLAAPGDVNWSGKTHGGTVMRWIDETAFACAASWSSDEAVSVYSGGIHFYSPIAIGDIVEIDSRLVHTGPHSMHIISRLRSGSPRTPHQLELKAQCISIFVVPDGAGAATPIIPLPIITPEDRVLDEHAVTLMAMRQALADIPLGLAREL
ncbi:acyl-CoA thioesterase [Galbitalea soli]|uniref:Acyl-CoA thioesterase n=1 Tax=Galbitalea soli TaxID=1268042 RepID=A0A7C9TR00_9MICO|nr:acyl-CoA thioesterase [Galbitalea soli]NEM91837.1 acyl-CoA thioesterase [Galbitalea soli]NYJ29329.1 4-hydroxybenzoyl-CoA thioesterase [Galbitalea soli]